jgi:hypothetical protein
MAARRPARSLLQEARVIDVSNENVSGCFLFLEMAFQAERSVALVQQALVDGAVRRMADRATLTQGLVLIHERAALLRVTFEAGFVFTHERKAARLECLLNVCRRAFDRDPLMYLVTVGAAHLAFRNRMMVRQRERRADFQVTLETGLGRFSWIDNRTSTATGLNVQTPGPMAILAPHVDHFFGCFGALRAGLTYDDLLRLQSRVGGCSKIANDLFVTGGAFF